MFKIFVEAVSWNAYLGPQFTATWTLWWCHLRPQIEGGDIDDNYGRADGWKECICKGSLLEQFLYRTYTQLRDLNFKVLCPLLSYVVIIVLGNVIIARSKGISLIVRFPKFESNIVRTVSYGASCCGAPYAQTVHEVSSRGDYSRASRIWPILYMLPRMSLFTTSSIPFSGTSLNQDIEDSEYNDPIGMSIKWSDLL